MSLFAMTLVIVSCSSSDDGDSGSGGVSSINLTSSLNGGLVGQQFTFTVKDNNNNNVTADAAITANGSAITGTHAFTATGVYDVIASYSGKTSNTLRVTVDEETSISLMYSPESVTNQDMGEFTVTNNLNNDVTSSATFMLDGMEITNPYQFTNLGDNEVTASYSSFTTMETITVTRGFTKKALLEDFTGTWCQFCPGAAAAITNVKNSNTDVLSVGYHVGVDSYPDPMEIPETEFFRSQAGVTGFPTVYYAGSSNDEWDYPFITQITAELNEKATLGLALDAEIVGGMLNVEVKVAFNETPTEELKLMLFLIEDNVTTSSSQIGSTTGVNYIHKDVKLNKIDFC